MRYCSKCVTPETQEGNQFDDNGVCLTCRNSQNKRENIDWQARRKLLDSIVAEYRGKNDYDCIVPFSGGKDSTYQLYFAVRELGLKPLVIRYDHWGFRPQVEENNRRTFRQLNCVVVQFTPDWRVVRELMRKGIELRGDFCWHCHTGIYGNVMQMAVKFNVPLVMWGEAPWEYSCVSSNEEIGDLEAQFFANIISLGLSAEDILKRQLSGNSAVSERDLRPFQFPAREEMERVGLRGIYLGNYIPWNSGDQAEIIKKELGWRGAAVEGIPPAWDYEKIECKWQGIRDWSKFIKRGFGRTAHLTSIEIRKGNMTREQAMALTKRYDGKRPASMDAFLETIGMDEKCFLDLMMKHQVAPWDFRECAYETGEPLPDMASWDK